MLGLAITFAVLALIAGLIGFTGIAPEARKNGLDVRSSLEE